MARIAHSQLLSALPYSVDEPHMASDGDAASLPKPGSKAPAKVPMGKSPRHPYVYKVEDISFDTVASV
ncbi:MAG: hypothetical protein AAFR58_02645 [Cyanobacteria bacterium J06627_28]